MTNLPNPNPSPSGTSPEARKLSGIGAVRLLSLVGLLVIVALLLFPGLGPRNTRWADAMWNLLHVPAFLGVTVALFYMSSSKWSQWTRRGLALSGGVLLALGTELSQTMVGRSGSVDDVMTDCVGIAMGLIWLSTDKKKSLLKWGTLVILMGLAAAICLGPAASMVLAEYQHRKLFPVIGGFSSVSSKKVWTGHGTTSLFRSSESDVLEVVFAPGEYGGLWYRPGRQDWSGCSALCLDLFNPGTSYTLGVRLDDRGTESGNSETWYSSIVSVSAGHSRVEIPLEPATGKIDLSGITRLVLFRMGQEERLQFTMNYAFLE